MRATVVCATARPGGMDLLLGSLALQSVLPERLVLVDGLHQFRHREVADAARILPYEVLHFPPSGNPWPKSAPARYLNTGIRLAPDPRDNVVIVVPDYTWLRPPAVEAYLSRHSGGARAALSPLPSVLPPAWAVDGYGLSPMVIVGGVHGVTGPTSASRDRDYVNEVYSGRLDPVMMCAFREHVGPRTSLGLDPSGPPSWLRSYRLDDLLAVDGLDERYDGGRPGLEHDELAARLRDQCEVSVVPCQSPADLPLGHRVRADAWPDEVVVRSTTANLELLQWAQRHGHPRAVCGIRLLPRTF